MIGAEALVKTLLSLQVDHVFNLPGVGMFPVIDQLYDNRDRIKYITALNETALTAMADGYARASGKPAFVNVYHATGTALALFGLITAWSDSSPLILTTTDSDRTLEGRDMHSAVPGSIIEMTKQFTKWSWKVPVAERIPEALTKAFTIASTPPRGPVHLSFPMDLYEEEVGEIILPHPENVFIHSRVACDPEGVKAAVEYILKANNPVIVTGADVTACKAREDLFRLAEHIAAPIFSEPFLPYHQEYYFGKFKLSDQMVKQADLLLFVGSDVVQATYPTDLGWRADLVNVLGSKKLVHLAVNSNDIGKQLLTNVGITSDIALGLRQITAEYINAHLTAADREKVTQRRMQIKKLQEARSGEIEIAQKKSSEDSVLIEQLVFELCRVFGNEVAILNHGTSGRKYLDELYSYCNSCAQEYFTLSPKGSAQGWGLPAAIGAQLAMPGKRVVAWIGDGGFMFTAQSLWTAAKFKIPIIAIILNNSGWRNFNYDKGEDEFGFKFIEPSIDYTALAKSMGVYAQKIERPQDIKPVLENAAKINAPVLIEAIVDF